MENLKVYLKGKEIALGSVASLPEITKKSQEWGKKIKKMKTWKLRPGEFAPRCFANVKIEIEYYLKRGNKCFFKIKNSADRINFEFNEPMEFKKDKIYTLYISTK